MDLSVALGEEDIVYLTVSAHSTLERLTFY